MNKRKERESNDDDIKNQGALKRTRTTENAPKNFHISLPGVLLINSKSQGGKSHLGHCIMYNHRKQFAWGVSFSQSGFNVENLSYVPGKFKHIRYSPIVLKALLMEQAKLINAGEKAPLVYIIFDDAITDIDPEDKVLKEAITQSKHYNIFILITTQSINALPTWIRENAFQICLFKMWTESAIEAAYRSYGQNHGNVKEFKTNVNNKLGDHVFAFSDRHKGDGTFIFCKCIPPPLPKFMLPDPTETKAEQNQRKGKKRKHSHSSEAHKRRRVAA
jgi:hypothetical protein